MKKGYKFLLRLALILISFLLIIVASPSFSRASQLDDIREEIEQYEKELGRLADQKNTLSKQISQFNYQIKLATLKIQETEEKIVLLGGRINLLEGSLQSLSRAFSSRVTETYKMTRLGDPFIMLLTAPDLNAVVSRFHYLKRIQESDRSLLVRLQDAQITYSEEKVDQEDLQADLENQKQVLGVQKEAKATLLEVTKNDERRYQELLAKARAELEAIQSILVGKGEEVAVGGVGQGDRIASIIPGSSACSTGTHLHFEVASNQSHQNPAGHLSSKSVEWDNRPDGPVSFSGSWPWPLNDPVRITQAYGMTYYASTLNYYGGSPHTGVDMVSDDRVVKAAQAGELYRGAIGCGGGTLRYVHIKQNDGLDAYYLHVNY